MEENQFLGRNVTRHTFHILCGDCVRKREEPGWPEKLKGLQAEYEENRKNGWRSHKPKDDPLAELYVRLKCNGCGRVFYDHKDNPYSHAPDCTGRCRAYAYSHAAYLQAKAIRAQNRAPRPCEQCGETFTPSRADARFCTTRCRMRAHRAM